MRKLNKIMMGLAAAALTLGAAYAVGTVATSQPAPQKAPEARATQTVSATWTLGDKVWSNVAAKVTNSNVITNTNLEFVGTEGAGVTSVLASSGQQTAKPSSGDITFTTWKVAVPEVKAKVEGNYVAFKLTSAMDFTPTNLTLKIATFNNGGARYDVEIVSESSTFIIASGITPTRSNRKTDYDANINFTTSYPLENIPAIKGDFEVRFYLWSNDGSAREVGFKDVCLTGTYSDGEGGDVNPDPVDDYFFHIPGTLDIPVDKTDSNYEWEGDLRPEIKNDIYNIGYTYANTSVTFKDVHVHEEGCYKAVLPLDYATNNGAKVLIEVTDVETGVIEASGELVSPRNNGAWQEIDCPLEGVVNEGVKNIKFSFTPGSDRNYAFNMRAPKFVLTAKTPKFKHSGDAAEIVLKARADQWFEFSMDGEGNSLATAVPMTPEVIDILHAAEFGGVNEDHYGNVRVSLTPDEETAQSFELVDKVGDQEFKRNKAATVGNLTAKEGAEEGASSLSILAHTAGRYTLVIENDEIQANGVTLLAKKVEIPVVVLPSVEGVGLTFNFIRHSYDGFNQETNNGYKENATPAIVYEKKAKPVIAGKNKTAWDYTKCLLYTDYAHPANVEIYWKYNGDPQAEDENPVLLRPAKAPANTEGIVPAGYTKFDINDETTAPNLETAKSAQGLSFVIKQNGIVGNPEKVSVYDAADKDPNAPTAVEKIDAAEGDEVVEYYNLQGIRVDGSARGVLIEVKRVGNSVESRRILK